MEGSASGGARNLSECARIDLPFTRRFLPAVFVLVFTVGCAANALGLRALRGAWRRHGSLGVLVLNLGVADLLYLCTLPFLVSYYAADKWVFGHAFCKVTRFLFNLNLYGSIGFLTCISLYRYLGIVHPMKVLGKIGTRTSVAVSALVWTLVLAQILPDMYFDKSPPNSTASCHDTTTDPQVREYLSYSLGWTFTGFVVPLLVILICYGHVVVVLATRANVDVLLKQRCLKLVVMLTILFSVCFIPYHVFRNLNLKTRILKLEGTCHRSFQGIYLAHQVSRGLVCLNSAINPLVYLICNDEVLARFHEVRARARQAFMQVTGTVIYRRSQETDSTAEARAEGQDVTMVEHNRGSSDLQEN